MDVEEFHQRLAAARARAALRRLEAVEVLATNVDLRRLNGDGSTLPSTREDRAVGVLQNPMRQPEPRSTARRER